MRKLKNLIFPQQCIAVGVLLGLDKAAKAVDFDPSDCG
jgi:hypothetical protein